MCLICILSCGLLLTVEAERLVAEDATDRDERPNFVFLLTDDHRHDQLGCAGHAFLKTPNIDKLARCGTRFSHCYVTTSICAASRASLLTGQVERTHGYTFGTGLLAKRAIESSYPARLRRHGYRTGLIGKLGVRVEASSIESMFDWFRPILRSPYFKKQKDGPARHTTDLCADRAIQFLKERKGDQPFCLTVSFSAPHAEDGDKANHFPPPPGTAKMYADVAMPPPVLNDPALFDSQPKFLRTSMNRIRFGWRWDTPEKYDRNLRNYYRMLSGIDAAIGRIVKELEAQGVRDKTVIIFSGDNGYYMGERGFAGKWSHFDESLRVPLIIHDPRGNANTEPDVNDAMVLNIDLPATMLDYAGLKSETTYQGKSLRPLVEKKPIANWRSEFFCEHLMNHRQIPKWEGIHGTRYVYARYFEQEPPFEFLHDLKTDPQQLKNVATEPHYQKILEQMRERTSQRIETFERARLSESD